MPNLTVYVAQNEYAQHKLIQTSTTRGKPYNFLLHFPPSEVTVLDTFDNVNQGPEISCLRSFNIHLEHIEKNILIQ
jgi:hypothetical protein